jgi:hypothetical protein
MAHVKLDALEVLIVAVDHLPAAAIHLLGALIAAMTICGIEDGRITFLADMAGAPALMMPYDMK